MATVREQLIAARALIKDPARWTQCAYARDQDQNEIEPWSVNALCFCAYGAIHHFEMIGNGPAERALTRATRFWWVSLTKMEN